jgi:hypothetical protein
MADNARPAPLTRHVRTIVPADIHARVSHLALDRNATLGEMVTEALVLLLRYHDGGSGFPVPMPPLSTRPAETAVNAVGANVEPFRTAPPTPKTETEPYAITKADGLAAARAMTELEILDAMGVTAEPTTTDTSRKEIEK